MKRVVTLSAVLLAGISLAACGNSQKQTSDNSGSAKVTTTKVQKHRHSTSESSSVTKKASQSSSSSQSNTSSSAVTMTNDQVAEQFRSLKGYTGTDYDVFVQNNHDGTYNIEVRRQAPDPQVTNMVGTYVYNPTTGAVTTTFETGL